MNFFIRLRPWAAIVCVALLALPPIEARNRKGDKFLKLGEKAEAQKDYDQAVNYYDQAVATEPKEAAYLLPDQRARLQAAQAHIDLGRKLRQQQKFEEALVQFQKAILADASYQVAYQEIRQTEEMAKQHAAAAGTPVLTPAEKAQRELEKRINSLEGPPRLRPINNQISSLKMNNQPARVLYESVAKLAGINVLFDPSGIETIAGRNFNLDLTNVTLEEALNYVALVTHTFWKPISHNAIFVTQDTEQKRMEYQDEMVKVFYIQNAATPQEFQEYLSAIRTGAKLNTGIFQVPSQNAIVVRGSSAQIALAEKVIHDLDRPKPEVVMDVIVMEVSKTKASTIGAALLGQGGLKLPLQFTPRNPTNIPTDNGSGTSGSSSTSPPTTGIPTGDSGTGTPTSQYITIARAGRFSSADYSISLPSTLVQALMTDSSTRILQRPQVRATDGGKASLKIGSKIPYVSGSLNSAVATPGAIPYATTQFQQVDVGTQIDFQPHVNGPNDVSMKVKVEISSVLQWLTIAGVQEPELSQQVDEADIRMKDGETSLLGGLSDVEHSNSMSGFPGLTSLPLLNYLFGARTKNDTDSEILMAVIPHIVRAPNLTDVGEEGVAAGTERQTRVNYRPDGSPSDPLPATGNQPTRVPSLPVAPPSAPPRVVSPYGAPQQAPVPYSNPQQAPNSNRQPPPANPNRQTPPGVRPPVLRPPVPSSPPGGPGS